MTLTVEDEIILTTRLGAHYVQLLLGDITELSVENKVDIVCTSAFPGDYGSGNPRTLIHALKKIGINVQSLAKQKDLDLRKNFSCWMSARLPEDKPYRRLVCFEINHEGSSITSQMSMVFRAMMPIFNGVESSVITPILATGCQHAPLDKMLAVMVNTACQWIKAGLPLKCLKLVLYTHDPVQGRKFQYKDAIAVFSQLKDKWQAKETKLDNQISYGVCYCYHKCDSHWVEKISDTLLSQKSDLKIHSAIFEKDENDSWQDEIFNVMVNSIRIVVILTPTFLSDVFCLEQFNMGMCCNRLKGDETVIPFYLETVQAFPSYMNLVQYTDCRVRNENETQEGKLVNSCTELLTHIRERSSETLQTKSIDAPEVQRKTRSDFDIFISYSHRDSELAKTLSGTLETKHPELNVFFDRADLKSGNIWQQSLYEAVDNTLCMVFLLSDPYIKSSVCQEELNIACGRQFAKDDVLILPVKLPGLTALPAHYNIGQLVSVSDMKEMTEFAEKLAAVVTDWKSKKYEKKGLKINFVKNVLSKDRLEKFNEKYLLGGEKKLEKKDSQGTYKDLEATITFSYVHDGLKLAAILSEMMKLLAPKVKMTLLSFDQSEARKMVDAADMVIMFVSDEYIQSQHHLQELHIALCKQRAVKESTVVYIIEADYTCQKPFYAHLLPYYLSMNDNIWRSLGKKTAQNTFKFNVHTEGMQGTYMCSSAQFLALSKAKFDVLDLLAARGQGSTLPTNIISVQKIKREYTNAPSEETCSLAEMTIPLSQLSKLSPMTTKNVSEETEDSETNCDDAEDESAAKNEGNDQEMEEELAVLRMLQNAKQKPPNAGAVIQELNEAVKSGRQLLRPSRRYSYEDLQDMVNKEEPGLDLTSDGKSAGIVASVQSTEIVQSVQETHTDGHADKNENLKSDAGMNESNSQTESSDADASASQKTDFTFPERTDKQPGNANLKVVGKDDLGESPDGSEGTETEYNRDYIKRAQEQRALMEELMAEEVVWMNNKKAEKKSKACTVL